MTKAIQYCHNNDLIHRDVKLENFLLDYTDDGKLVIRLADFGLVCQYRSNEPPTLKCGSLCSIAPEMLVEKSYCKKVDIWGLGVVLYELLSTDMPFYSDDDKEFRDNIIN